MLSWLFPDERTFYQGFSGVGHQLTAIALLLEDGFAAPERFPALLGQIRQLDQDTDRAARALDADVERQFIPPMDREDIHRLSTLLARVVDIIGGTAGRAVSLRATERQESAVALARVLVQATREIAGAVDHLRESDAVLAHCREIKQDEEEGDRLWEAAVSELFETERPPLDIIRWKTLYDQLEEALDACDDVANELETITVKHM